MIIDARLVLVLMIASALTLERLHREDLYGIEGPGVYQLSSPPEPSHYKSALLQVEVMYKAKGQPAPEHWGGGPLY